MPAARLEVLRVFVAPDGRGGNPLGVFPDPPAPPEAAMQRIAADLGFSETVFVEDRQQCRLRIFSPSVELPLAGHPLVGTSWLLHEEGEAPDVLRPPAGEITTWQEGELTWIRADPAVAPEFDFLQLDSAEEVHDLTASPDDGERTVAWAWADESVGTVRARAFLPRYGITEDEATGAAALRLCALTGRALAIHQGQASLLHVQPAHGGLVELGGRTRSEGRRRYGGPIS